MSQILNQKLGKYVMTIYYHDILQLSSKTTSNVLHRLFNEILKKFKFPGNLKLVILVLQEKASFRQKKLD